MKHSIRLTGPNGAHVYLSHRGKVSFGPATARKYLAQYLAQNPGAVAWIEDEWREPVQTPERLEARARRLYALRLIDPKAPPYALADLLMEQARALRATLNPSTP